MGKKKKKDFMSGGVSVRVEEMFYPEVTTTIRAGNRSMRVHDIAEAEDFLDAFAQFVLENSPPHHNID